MQTSIMAAGDVNEDGVPDFAAGADGHSNGACAFLGSFSNGLLNYTAVTLPTPASNPGKFGGGVAMGKLDGSASGDELAVGASGTGTGKKAKPGVVYSHKFNGSDFDLIGISNDPTHTMESFGSSSVAVDDVAGDSPGDLIVGAPGGNQVLVFPAPLSSPSFYYTLSSNISGTGFWARRSAPGVPPPWARLT